MPSRKTGGIHFGSKTNGHLKEVISGFRKLGFKHQVLSAAEANSRFGFIKLPSQFICAIEEDAGVLLASKALDAFQVSLCCW